MGTLVTDNIFGLGNTNPIKGSVYFRGYIDGDWWMMKFAFRFGSGKERKSRMKSQTQKLEKS